MAENSTDSAAPAADAGAADGAAPITQSRQVLEAILDYTPAVIYVKDAEGRYVYVNRRYETLFRVSRRQVIGRTAAAVFPREIAAVFQKNDEEVLRSGVPLEAEESAPLEDGPHTFLSIKFPICNGAGVPYAVGGIDSDITERKQAEDELRESQERFVLQQSALIALTRGDAFQAPDLATALRLMTEVVAQTLDVERVSIWRYTGKGPAIRCVDLYERGGNRHSCGQELAAADYPAYFVALALSEVVAADDAHHDVRTREFSASYLTPLGITSMMDVPIYFFGELDGVLCHEHVGPPRHWKPDEKMFGTAVANLISLSMEQSERKRAEAALRESEGLYHSLVECLPQNIFRKDLDGRFTFANHRYLATLGRRSEEVIGKTDYDFFPAPLAAKYRRDDEAVVESERTFQTVEEHVTPAGEKLFVQVVKTPVKDASGRITGTQCLFWDVTEQKRTERRLAVQHAATQVLAVAATLSEAIPKILRAICETLVDWEWGAFWQLEAEAKVLRCAEIWHAPALDAPEFEAMSREIGLAQGVGLPGRVWATGEPAWIADVVKDSNFPRAPAAGRAGLHGAFAFPIRGGGKLLGVIEFFHREIRQPDDDLVQVFASIGSQLGQFIERKRAEDALRESEERFALATWGSNDGLWDWDISAGKIYFSPRWKNMLGCEDHEIAGRFEEWEKRLHPDDRARALTTMHAYLDNLTPYYELEHRLRHKDGSYRWILARGVALRDANGKPYRMAGSHTDITDRKLAEEQLLLQNTRLQEMAASERAAHEELKTTQSQLVQAEKMSSLGQMVAGVAHEINNPLSFVANNVAVLQRDMRPVREVLGLYQEADELLAQHRPDLNQRIRELAERIDLPYTVNNLDELILRSRDGLRRIQQIVKDLRDFARLDESDLHEVDLRAGIESTINIIRGRAKKNEVEIALELAPLPQICCYPARVNQVVLNLVANAIDACAVRGKVSVRTARVPNGVEIHVLDNGKGIDPAIRHKVFDPFFTTKPPGEGTGLGLSISYAIVRDHGGTIDFDSTPGQGTQFVVRLPLRPPVAADRPNR